MEDRGGPFDLAQGKEERCASETWEMVASEYRKVKCFTGNGRISRLNGRFGERMVKLGVES
jgi:hypothetical protein